MAAGIVILGPLGIAMAVFDVAFRHRAISDAERLSKAVFRNTLPDRSRIVLTNASHGGGWKFTPPNVDGTCLVSLGMPAIAPPPVSTVSMSLRASFPSTS